MCKQACYKVLWKRQEDRLSGDGECKEPFPSKDLDSWVSILRSLIYKKLVNHEKNIYSFLTYSVVFIFYYTFLPHPSLGIGVDQGTVNLNPFAMFQRTTLSSFCLNVFGNIVLFAPFGFALRRSTALNGFWVVVIGGILSVSIELTQLAMPSRTTDIDDVILNTLGAGLGALLYSFWRK